MAKQGKGIKSENNNNVGKGKVTPVQVAFIVDRYLADNNFSNTRTAFRSEASSLISKSSFQEAPKSLLSLGELLDEYIWLKEQKVLIEQEKCGLAQEKCRVQTLLQGMQDLMTAYNSPVPVNSLTLPPTAASPAHNSMPNSSSTGCPAYRTPVMTSMSMTTQSVKMDHTNFSTPINCSRPPRKRKSFQDVPQAPKKFCGTIATDSTFYNKGSNQVERPNNLSKGHINNHQSHLPSLSPNFAQGGSVVQGSSVAKNLFDKPSSSPLSNSSGPQTPPRALSSQSDKSISPLEDVSSVPKSHDGCTPPETTPTNCTIISSKTIIVSPAKQFSIERSQCTFSSPMKSNSRQSKRECVKGRLDFDSSDVKAPMENASGDGSSSTSESEKEGDIFDLELPDFDAFGPGFSLTELLTDFGIDCEGLDYSCPTTAGASTNIVPVLVHEGKNGELGSTQDMVQHSSAVREVIAEDGNLNGTDSITSVKSVRKCIRIVSPTKCSRANSVHDLENLSAGS